MKKNSFGDMYAQSSVELATILSQKEMTPQEVYCPQISEPEPGTDEPFEGEILENIHGMLVCYVEGPTEHDVRQIILSNSIEIPD
jgi:hypothetical protein